MDLRACYQPSTNDNGGLDPSNHGHRVKIHHSWYRDDGFENLLLDLKAPDSPSGGLHHGTVKIACYIITCNRWDGYLSTSTKPEGKLQIALHAVLAAGSYYFLLPRSPDSNGKLLRFREPCVTRTKLTCLKIDGEPPHSICPTFRDWNFPHKDLPPVWKEFSLGTSDSNLPISRTTHQTEAAESRDRTCRISDSIEGLQVAHIIPRKEDHWFTKNYMYSYNTDKHKNNTVTNVSNLFLVRADLHIVYDMHKWTMVLKESSRDQGRLELVFHQLKQATELS